MIQFHQQVFFNVMTLVVAVVAIVRNLKIIRNPQYYARTPQQRSGRRQGRRRRRDENEDDKRGDKDNEDDDVDPKMAAKNYVISRAFRTNIVFPVAFSNLDRGE